MTNKREQHGNANTMQWDDKVMLTLNEACIYMGISKQWIYKMTHRRIIPYYKPGGKMVFFHRADLDAYMSRGKVMSKAEIEQEAAKKRVAKKLNVNR